MDWLEQKIGGEVIYRGKVVNLHVDRVRLPGGRQAQREVVEHRGAVVIAALDDQNELALVRQYRYPVGEVTLELPAGTLEPGEEPRAAAQRELAEETGLEAASWRDLMTCYSSPGFCTEKMHFFLANRLTRREQHTDADEKIEVVFQPLLGMKEMVLSGQIHDAKTALAVLAVAALAGT